MVSRFRAWMLALGIWATWLAPRSLADCPVTLGLDHLTLAVGDLERACTTFLELGFALKPGRAHDNGIRNAHLKFVDGAGIELLAVPEINDALTAHYAAFLDSGDGPAFMSLHARDTRQLHACLTEGGYGFRQAGDITQLSLPEFDCLFLVRDNRSVSDRPEHFAHANGAMALSAVWIATEHGDDLVRLLVQLGGTVQSILVQAPEPVRAQVVSLDSGQVVILPASHQRMPGRPVIGASFSVADLAKVRQVLANARIKTRDEHDTSERVLVEPEFAHGLWLEFRPGS